MPRWLNATQTASCLAPNLIKVIKPSANLKKVLDILLNPA